MPHRDPAKVLASYAAPHDIDGIVMGRVRYSGLDKLIGSTVEAPRCWKIDVAAEALR
ncbi:MULTISPECIES: hypothetical protein [unclassified Pseudomonas]|uniref:hypothetical protein n=1 Tax=unclassified Pseudomonas TaxID=196821 RepID=UPI00087143FD|nr:MULTISPECIES: hypothetical protein [unclassified Pseudomonas]SCW68084.1 hypothetical protein SAMN03159481_01915 [Pseudomonas sp. NFACC56-3]SFK33294.1 hypothetical protein SAMN03159473_01439 [Pseudomonas sp. NFACC52]